MTKSRKNFQGKIESLSESNRRSTEIWGVVAGVSEEPRILAILVFHDPEEIGSDLFSSSCRRYTAEAEEVIAGVKK